MGCGGADIGEDADISGDVGLCAGGENGLGGGEARWLVRYRFPRVCGEQTSQTVSHSFSISAVMCFWSA